MTQPNPIQQAAEDAHLQALIMHCLTVRNQPTADEQGVFSDFYEAAAPGVYRLAYSILLHKQDAEDVVQESMVYAFRNLHRYDPIRGAVRTWLYTITVSRCRNARRRKWLPQTALSQLLQIGQEPSAPLGEAPEAAIARMGVRDALEKALATLTPRLREAVALRYGQGLTYREMAEILDCPQKTAESRVRLAHEALREALHSPDAALVEELWSFA
jgi:RNA polymerase sigma-70 factor (ECF subfamily)